MHANWYASVQISWLTTWIAIELIKMLLTPRHDVLPMLHAIVWSRINWLPPAYYLSVVWVKKTGTLL